ncbi:MAG: ectoine/hydroxyectoine ABC transporter substrate-binding protein EhuB [Nocardioidaceae bacterium]
MSDRIWTRRNFLRRGAFVAGGAIMVPGLLSACGESGKSSPSAGSGLDALKKKGTITVGIAGEEPYGFLKGGELTGEAPTVQTAIWNALGIDTVKAKQTEFDGLIPGLKARHFDVVAAGMFITPDRCAEANFSDPVYCAPEAFMVPKGNPKNLTDFKSAAKAGVKLGVFGGAVEGDYAKKSGVKAGNITTLPNQRAGITQLQQGRIDAIALTSISLNWALKQQSEDIQSKLEVTEGFVPKIDGKEILGCGAAVFRDDQDDLRKAFNEQLAKLKDSGKLTQMIEQFGFGKETLPPEDITTEKLCKG